MKALSVKQPWANLILTGEKSIEVRSKSTSHRGDLLICSSKSPALTKEGMDSLEDYIGLPYTFGQALFVARLVDSRPLQPGDEAEAFMEKIDTSMYGWILKDIRSVQPFPVKGALGLYEVDDALIKTSPYALMASVRVRGDVQDDDLGMAIAGWTGRIASAMFDEEEGWLFALLPDSISLQEVTAAHIESSAAEGEDWKVVWLFADDLEPAESRDTIEETAKAIEEIEARFPALFSEVDL